MITREWWTHGLTWTSYFISTTNNSSYRKVVTKIVEIIVVLDLLFNESRNKAPNKKVNRLRFRLDTAEN